MHIKSWSENLKERDHLEVLGVDGRHVEKHDVKKWAEFISLTISSSGGLL
jgi:hypothetical protein